MCVFHKHLLCSTWNFQPITWNSQIIAWILLWIRHSMIVACFLAILIRTYVVTRPHVFNDLPMNEEDDTARLTNEPVLSVTHHAYDEEIQRLNQIIDTLRNDNAKLQADRDTYKQKYNKMCKDYNHDIKSSNTYIDEIKRELKRLQIRNRKINEENRKLSMCTCINQSQTHF